MYDVYFMRIFNWYFRGERLESLVFILPLGLACMALGAYLLFRPDRTAFSLGFSIPFVALGLLLLVVGATVGFRTPEQVKDLEAKYLAAPGSMGIEEAARMRKVNEAWPKYLGIWAAFVVLGMFFRFGVKPDWAQGLGIALVFFGGVGLIVDGFAERRARVYTSALEEFTGTRSQGR